LSFDWDFFYQPERRLLYERFGDVGLGQKDAPRRPIIGPVLMGSGYIVQDVIFTNSVLLPANFVMSNE
jgi:hypothetical protein